VLLKPNFEASASLAYISTRATSTLYFIHPTVKCTGNPIPCVRTKRAAENIRIRNEIKFLYKKKQQLNRLLYESHLDNAFVWDKLWNVLESNIDEKLEVVMQRKYLVQERKLKKLRELKMENIPSNKSDKQNNPSESPLHNFYPKVVNKTNIDFTKEEIVLLNKGLQYNIHCKKKIGLRI
jgi:hypothetical protein